MQSEWIVAINVIPRSQRNEIVGWKNGELRVRIKAVPEQGKANATLLCFLADECDLPVSHLELLSGHTNRHKRVKIKGYKGTGIPELK